MLNISQTVDFEVYKKNNKTNKFASRILRSKTAEKINSPCKFFNGNFCKKGCTCSSQQI